MNIALGCDHAGFPLKARLAHEIQAAGHQVVDVGAFDETPSDYPDFALKVAQAVISGRADRGILACGSGVGASVAANKVPGARSALCHDSFTHRQGVEDDDMNILALGARVIGPELAADLVRIYLDAKFSHAERHQRRLNKVHDIELAAQGEGQFDSPQS